MVTAIDNGLRGLTDSSFNWIKADGSKALVVMPTAVGYVYDPKAKLTDVFKSSKLGVKVIAQRLLDEQAPEIEFDFGIKTVSVLSMLLGYHFSVQGSATFNLINTLLVTANSYPAAAAGYEGYGVTADIDSFAYYEPSPGVNVALTQLDYSAIDPAADTFSFAIGASNAKKFTDDLIGKVVSLMTPITLSNVLQLTDTDFTTFELRFNQILVDKTILNWYFPSVTVKRDASKVDDKLETKVTFSVNDDGSGCGLPTVTYLGTAQKRSC